MFLTDERYHSASGLKYDLIALQKILAEADQEALLSFIIGTQDVSSFFMLPTALFGRGKEHEEIVKIINKVSQRQLSIAPDTWSSAHKFSTSSTTSDGRHNYTEFVEGASSDTSSQRRSRSNSGMNGGSTFLGDASKIQPDSANTVETTTTTTGESFATSIVSQDHLSLPLPASRSLSARPRYSQGSRRKGKTEIITIVGSAGMGKSSLVHSVQGEIRRQGYYANSKFDNARKAPFEPLLRIMSSLFRQIFSESDVDTAYHNMIRLSVKGIWHVLSNILDLPENLIFGGQPRVTRLNKSLTSETNNIVPSISSAGSGSHLLPSSTRGAVVLNPLRISSTYIDVLRALASGKLICMCVDDLQFADEESLELIANIVFKRIRLVLITTCRHEEEVPIALKPILDGKEANITRLQLGPLSEEDVLEYVASTLYRSKEYVFPLAAVALEKTNGNPFYLRQMLDLCYRKACVWFDWQSSAWQFDLDRIFNEFETENYG